MHARLHRRVRLRRLLPLGVYTNQTAYGASETNNAVVKIGPRQGGGGDGQVAEVGKELEAATSAFTIV